jgi:hypothetical protein
MQRANRIKALSITGLFVFWALLAPMPSECQPPIQTSASLPFSWLLAAAAHAPGAGGAFWVTHLTILNHGATDATFALLFSAHDQSVERDSGQLFHLHPRQTLVIKDVLSSIFALESGFGAIRLAASSGELAMWGETITAAPGGGTYGQCLAAFSKRELITSQRPGSIEAICQNAVCRTNLVLANASAIPISVDLNLYDESGQRLSQSTQWLAARSMTQISNLVPAMGISTELANGCLRLSTSTVGGTVAAYASVIDNQTNDPRTLPASTAFTWLLPASAHVGGMNNSLWTTNLTLSNLGGSVAAYSLDFLENGTPPPAIRTVTRSLGAGKTVGIQDVLAGRFQLNNGFGAIRLRTESNRFRMSGQTSTRSASGSYGQNVTALSDNEMITEVTPRWIGGICEDDSFHTNLILSNGTDQLTLVTLELFSSEGDLLAQRQKELQPLEMTQLTRLVREMGISGDLKGASLRLSSPTTGATIGAYASVIDNITNDPRTYLSEGPGIEDSGLNLPFYKETAHFRFYNTRRDAACADQMAAILEEGYVGMANRYRTQLNYKVGVRIYPSISLLHEDKGVTDWGGRENWVTGMVLWGGLAIVSPYNPGPMRDFFSSVHDTPLHELDHVFVYGINPNVPFWLGEGLATNAGPSLPESKDRQILAKRLNQNSIPTFDELNRDYNSFMFNDGYTFAKTIVEFLFKEYDNNAMNYFIRHPTDYMGAFGISQQSLWENWVAYIKEKYSSP